MKSVSCFALKKLESFSKQKHLKKGDDLQKRIEKKKHKKFIEFILGTESLCEFLDLYGNVLFSIFTACAYHRDITKDDMPLSKIPLTITAESRDKDRA